MKTFSQFTDKPYQIAHCFKEFSKNLNIKQISLILEKQANILHRGDINETKEFNELVRCVLKPPQEQLWGIMWKMKGTQTKTIRNECRSLIHDALIENQNVQTVSHPKFVSLDARIETFVNWPINKEPKKERLAEAGYFYDPKNTILRCFYCDGVSWDLKPDEDPWARHAKWYFNCPYVRASKTEEFINKCRFTKLKRNDVYNVEYIECDNRLKTFDNWPIESCPKPCLLSRAGFYFTHLEDKVVCYHCGYGVRNWKKMIILGINMPGGRPIVLFFVVTRVEILLTRFWKKEQS
ncbi:unnamed protein product [Mytilus coruscus]|uniref:BIRC7_8 n=1 Tax=Mytilus coruscus TaxID=42192 RepID=A0A6J8AGF6_MYTCO|nr:unnamed protein product [Mytilus coruscus]